MTNLSRRDPFGEMLSLRDAMNQLFQESFVSPAHLRAAGSPFDMAADVSETADRFVVEVAVPGVRPDDLDITLQDNVLTITGETRQEPQAGGQQANYHRVERRYGRFSRAISLPRQVNADQVQATLEHGILRLDIPKAEAVKPRKIALSAGQAGQGQLVDAQGQEQQSQPQNQTQDQQSEAAGG